MSKSKRSSQPSWNEESFAGGAQSLRELIKKPKSHPTTKDAIRRYVPLIDKAIELGYDYQDIAQAITTGSGITVSVANLRRYYKEFQTSPQGGDGENQGSVEQLEESGRNPSSSNRNGAGRSKGATVRSSDQPTAAQKVAQAEDTQVPDETKLGRENGASSTPAEPLGTAASLEPAKTDDKPEPKKKLTMLERLKLMSDDDDVYVPDDDDEEDDDDAPVIRGNFSIMPPDDEL